MVVDVYCPRKMDKQGLPFGFVRFEERKEEHLERLLENLNNLWIGRVYLPRFERSQPIWKTETPQVFSANMGVIKLGRSFAEACKNSINFENPIEEERTPLELTYNEHGKQMVEVRVKQMDTSKSFGFVFEPSEEEKSWLLDCWVGLLKDKFVWEEVENEIRSECGNKMRINFLGDNTLLFRCRHDDHIGDLMKDMDEWCSYWMEWSRPWRESDVCQRRRVWTRWRGSPSMHGVPDSLK